MANIAAIKPVTRTINLGDGVERKCTFTLNAMAELELKYGSIDAAFKAMQDGSICAIRFLLWLIIVPDGQEMTEKEIGAKIDLTNLSEIMDSVMDMFTEAMPDSANETSAPNRQTLANW